MAWYPQPGPQSDAISADWCPELFFGGARGGGKSAFLLGDFLQDVYTYGAAWQGVIFRRTYPELQDLIAQSSQIFAGTGCMWYEQTKGVTKSWVWPNGAVLRFRYLESVKDASRYQGHQYTWIGWDEKQQWQSLEAYGMLKACLRSAVRQVRTKRIRSTGNPGGVGHNALKEYFIDHNPGGYKVHTDDKGTRMFIPSRVTDNRILMEKDPDYVTRLMQVGSQDLIKMWLYGDWNVVAGNYFPEFGAQHIIKPFAIPTTWAKYRSFDWGSYRPFSVGWWAVADGTGLHPRGALIKYREWYGSNGKANEGLKLTVEEIAQGIKSKEHAKEDFVKSVADPSIFKTDGGPSIAERFKKSGISFAPADNTRIMGAEQVRSRLKGENNTPMIYFFDTCVDSIRTIPALQHDSGKPEDVDSNGEDHAYDEARYMCTSRIYTKDAVKAVQTKYLHQYTYDDILRQHRQNRED